MRKALALILSAALVLCLSGCENLVESEYSTSGIHNAQASDNVTNVDMTLEASDRDGLYNAIMSLVNDGAEHGIIRIVGYGGDLEADLAQAVATVANDSPYGAYCAYYINYSVIRIVSMYQANISIVYRHTPEEAGKALMCHSAAELREIMLNAILNRTETFTVYTLSEDLDEQAVLSAMESVYYDNPADILYIPSCSVTSYPETGPERILEIGLTFQYAAATVEARRENMLSRAAELMGYATGATTEQKLMSLAGYFMENVTFDMSVNTSDAQARRYNAMTAYGALVQKVAVGEGYAMAMKVICDMLGIECHIIRGRFNNVNHAWNLVRLSNGGLYHMDCSTYDGGGAAVFRNDLEQISYNYSWDASQYPECSSSSLYG